jgi:hypothetical protein
MIDWSKATDDELGELYDALYERNTLVVKNLEAVHTRIAIGSRYHDLYRMKDALCKISKDLADSVREEIRRRNETGAITAPTE